jgi:uncharacterized protein (TIGR02246 family)
MISKATTAGSDADRQAVLDVLARVHRAWEAGDAEAFAAAHTEDASVIQPAVYEKDREEIRANMAAAFAGPLNGSRARWTSAFLSATRPSWSARTGSSSLGRTLSRGSA